MGKEEKIFICYGSSGIYEDHNEWFVRAFKNEDDAKNFVGLVSELARLAGNALIEAHRRYFEGETGVWPDPKDFKNELDPRMILDNNTSVFYGIAEIILES